MVARDTSDNQSPHGADCIFGLGSMRARTRERLLHAETGSGRRSKVRHQPPRTTVRWASPPGFSIDTCIRPLAQ